MFQVVSARRIGLSFDSRLDGKRALIKGVVVTILTVVISALLHTSSTMGNPINWVPYELRAHMNGGSISILFQKYHGKAIPWYFGAVFLPW